MGGRSGNYRCIRCIDSLGSPRILPRHSSSRRSHSRSRPHRRPCPLHRLGRCGCRSSKHRQSHVPVLPRLAGTYRQRKTRPQCSRRLSCMCGRQRRNRSRSRFGQRRSRSFGLRCGRSTGPGRARCYRRFAREIRTEGQRRLRSRCGHRSSRCFHRGCCCWCRSKTLRLIPQTSNLDRSTRRRSMTQSGNRRRSQSCMGHYPLLEPVMDFRR